MLSGEKGIGKYTLIFHLINYFLSQNDSQSIYNIENKVIKYVAVEKETGICEISAADNVLSKL